ncbi:hypothetical protein DEJ51_28490 [Streptomyces venezuelae]|uniref:Uncharacterized protein n=1 Tax=Streptomyces venezuelae TaxID=54571 RepID=A0A5P2DTK5_STRVZ|nr:hypothetical protein [Streptomyces venezuelae]QES57637.1 hypothetical protein DEJ51_28490 [Streptomyces venezuelae]
MSRIDAPIGTGDIMPPWMPPRDPWDAFAVSPDVSAMYGQPSAALITRARQGWQKIEPLRVRTGEDGIQ